MCAKIQQIHKDHSGLVFLYFDETYKGLHLDKKEQLREIDFDDNCYEQISKSFEDKDIAPRAIIFRFVPEDPILFLPQTLDLTNECKEEIEIKSIPLLLYDEMLPMV